VRALQGKGIEDIAEVQYTDRKFLAHEYLSTFGAGTGTAIGDEPAGDVLFPELDFFTNDSWALVRAQASGRGYPLLILNRYAKGILYILTIPDNFNDLYRLPVAVTTALKSYVMRGFPVRLDGPAQVALFAYDNHTFIVESYRAEEASVRISILGRTATLRNLATGETLTAQAPATGNRRRGMAGEPLVSFETKLHPHSYAVFAVEP